MWMSVVPLSVVYLFVAISWCFTPFSSISTWQIVAVLFVLRERKRERERKLLIFPWQ